MKLGSRSNFNLLRIKYLFINLGIEIKRETHGVMEMAIKVSLIILLVLISILVMPTTLAQSDEDAYMILVTFSEPMSKYGIFIINNYEVLANDNVPVIIYKVGKVFYILIIYCSY